MVQLKIGRRIFDISDRDEVMFNGACWKLITQEYFCEWNYCSPVMSKTMCEKFVKRGILRAIKATPNGMYYYRFDVDKLKEFVKEQGEKK